MTRFTAALLHYRARLLVHDSLIAGADAVLTYEVTISIQ